jgi:hypothetical protein
MLCYLVRTRPPFCRNMLPGSAFGFIPRPAEQILKLGICFADTAHSAEIADIAKIIGARVKRDDAGAEHLVRWRTIEARARGNHAIFEIEIAIGFFPAQLRDNLVLSHAGPPRSERCLHRGDDAFERFLKQ